MGKFGASGWWREKGARVAVGGDATYSALGPYSSVVVNHPPVTGEDAVVWPVEVGAVPALASAFQPRTELRERIDAARAEAGTAVLTQVLSGGGGVGKSQLAASYAARAVAEGTELVVWAPATEVQQVVTLFAEAAARVSAPGASGESPEADARAFLSWLATTSRRWLVVLDDITDPAGVEPLWPVSRTGSGWVLATTRLHDARLTGGGRRKVSVDVYEQGEAAAYLRARLAEEPGLADEAVEELAEELGLLPLALGHAAAFMINHGLTCTAYLELFRQARTIAEVLPADADTEGYGRAVTATLLLSLGAVETVVPAALVRPVLWLAAVLDPAGHPEALWSAEPVLEALGCDAAAAREALRVLHRYALLTRDAGVVRIHALTARAVRETIPEEALPLVAVTAADGLCEIWPHPDTAHRELAAVLRANTDSLVEAAGEHLWDPEGHIVLHRAANSLADAGLTEAALEYLTWMGEESIRISGFDHPQNLTITGNLASAFQNLGHLEEATETAEWVLRRREEELGEDHFDTGISLAQLLVIHTKAGRVEKAIEVGERALAIFAREAGPEHYRTIGTLTNLAAAYLESGRTEDAVAILEEHLENTVRILGAEHPYTLSVKNNLGYGYADSGRRGEALALYTELVADAERLLGPDNPETRAYRQSLEYLSGLGRFHWRRLRGR
ncbi:tetratricopeptide repeat protein [Streptomyces sp. NPDC004267]|uniref:tetratricopeptide repeat protein n=1 Tax=Streptomyces sp. NPDC004267 TaxID=3364694 RepID=UPI0036CB239E